MTSILDIVLFFLTAQNPRIMAKDESNWAEILKVMNASAFDGKSDDDLHVFERILRSNAIERGRVLKPLKLMMRLHSLNYTIRKLYNFITKFNAI